MDVEFFSGTINGDVHIANLPGTGDIRILTSADVTVAFWNSALGDYGAAETVSSPGDEVSCASSRMKLSGAASVVVKA